MRAMATLVVALTLCASNAIAQRSGINSPEPPASLLGAPLYPGSEFLRVMTTLDPFYETVFYISPEPVGDVKNFYRTELPKAKLVQYKDEDEWVWTYLLIPNMPFPDKPTRDDLPLLDSTPNVMVKKFQKMLHEPLIELYQSRPDGQKKLEALENAKTIIRFTYRKVEEDIGFKGLQGIWINVDRSLPEYYKCRFSFNADSTYTFTLTDENISALTAKHIKASPHAGSDANTERGRFSVLRNTIDMEADEPVVGDKVKSGLIEIKDFTFSVQFINMPRLTFMRDKSR